MGAGESQNRKSRSWTLFPWLGEWLRPWRFRRGESPSILLEAAETGQVETEVVLQELTAPIQAGEVVGQIHYQVNGKTVAQVDITAVSGVEAVTFSGALGRLLQALFQL